MRNRDAEPNHVDRSHCLYTDGGAGSEGFSHPAVILRQRCCPLGCIFIQKRRPIPKTGACLVELLVANPVGHVAAGRLQEFKGGLS